MLICNVFLLAFGCEELFPQPGQHISISDIVATISCDTTDAVQEMRCVDSVWEGDVMECEIPGSNFNNHVNNLTFLVGLHARHVKLIILKA